MALLHSSLPEVVTVGFAILALIWILSKYGGKNRRGKFPPGPRPWPVVGNLPLLGTLPHRTFADLAKRYGPLLFLRLGSVPTVVVSSSSMAKEFLKTHDLVFANRPSSSAGKYLFYGHKDVAFGSYGEYWRRMKKVYTVELLTAKRVASFECVREEEVSAMIRSLWEESGCGMHSVDVTKSLKSMSRNVICKMFSSRTYSEAELGGGHDFTKTVDEFFTLGAVFCIGDFIPYLDWLDLGGFHRRMKKVAKVLDDFIEKVIDERIKRRRTSNGEQENGRVKDLVDVLLDTAETEGNSMESSTTRISIKAIILDVLVGGIDTTSTTIEWAMSELLRNPYLLARVHQELDSVVGRHRLVKESDLASCEYLQCVIKETFRLHPPGPLLIPHESREDLCVGEYFIPRKARVIINGWAIGRDESVWGDAENFKPERFIGKDIDVKGQHFDLIPFGSGRRACPAISAGLRLVEVAVAQLAHSYEWSVEGEEVKMEEESGLTVPRKYPLFARPARRLTTIN